VRRPRMRIANQRAATRHLAVLHRKQTRDRTALDLLDPCGQHLGLADIARRHLIDPIRPTRGHIAQRRRLHDLPGLAVAALRNLLGDPRLLQRVVALGAEAFDGGDFLADDVAERSLAGAHRFAIDVNCASATQACAAAKFCTGHLQLFADGPEQRRIARRLDGHIPPIDIEIRHRRVANASDGQTCCPGCRCYSGRSKQGDIVLDPFCGSGTILIAAERTGRKARALEIDPAYVDVAIRRWEALAGKSAKLSTGETFEEIAEQRIIQTDIPQAEAIAPQTGGPHVGPL
jgi:hypothetical protein